MEDKTTNFLKKGLLMKVCHIYRERSLYRKELTEEILFNKNPKILLNRLQTLDQMICRAESNLQIGNYRRAWHLLALVHFLSTSSSR